MATYNFLDKTGLGLVWAKIKALIPSKTSDLQNDSGFIIASDVPEEMVVVKISGNDTIGYSADKTYAELRTARVENKNIILKYSLYTFHLFSGPTTSSATTKFQFGTLVGGTNYYFTIDNSNTVEKKTLIAVSSVNNKTGSVVLDAADVGALPASTIIPDELSELSDTTITTPSNGQILKYNSTTSKWVNADESSDIFIVTVSGSPKTSNKTFSEISAAITAGKEVICIDSGTNYIYQLQSYGNSEIRFILTELYYDGEANSYEVYTNYVTIDSSNSVTADYVSHAIPHITINGSATINPSFYAPTSAGTSGYVLTSNGSGAPTWQQAPAGVTVTLNGSTTTTPSFYAPTTSGQSGWFLKSTGTGAPVWDVIYPEAMVVNISGPAAGPYTCDKTFSQIYDFIDDDDGVVICKYSSRIYQLTAYTSTYINFEYTYVDEDDGDYYVITDRATINSNNVVNIITLEEVQIPLPSTLTPYSDAASGSAGGSVNYARADHKHPKITQTLSMSNNVITLTGSDGTTSSVTLPVFNGSMSAVGGGS